MFANSEDNGKSMSQQRHIDAYTSSFQELQDDDDDDNFVKDATNSKTTSNDNQHEEVEYNWALQHKITQKSGRVVPM